MNKKDQSDLAEISLTVALFLRAWGKGDDCEIQGAVELMHEWSNRRAERLCAEPKEKRPA